MKALCVLAFALALIHSPIGYAQPVTVSVVPVASLDDFKGWVGKSVDPARVAAYPGRLTELPFGQKTQLPIVVSGLPTPAPHAMQLVADVEILGTDGKSLGASPRCCQASVAKGSTAQAVLLTTTVGVEPEAGHRKGSYTVRVSVTDGTQTWTATEVLPYGARDVPGSSSEVPRLRMNVPPNAPTGDRRDCLSLPTPSEVIKCSERK